MATQIRFAKSPIKHKKYRVTFKYKNSMHTVDFGDARYEHYQDRTPLKLYKRLDHKDADRRARYLARAQGIKNGAGRKTKDDPRSPNYWSINYLW